MPRGILASSIVLLAVVLAPARLWGAESHDKPAWWIDARPWTCSTHIPALAREVALASDAMGTCTLAGTEGTATHRAVLICHDTGWSLEAWTASGERLWTLE